MGSHPAAAVVRALYEFRVGPVGGREFATTPHWPHDAGDRSSAADAKRKESNNMTTAVSIEVNVRRVLLRVSNIERATRFCRDVLGLRVVVYGPDFGLQAAFLTGGPRHHFLLTTWNGSQKSKTTEAT